MNKNNITMPRHSRPYAPGLLYHAFSRGNNKQTIFLNNQDYQRFKQNLERFRKQFNFKLYAYCLLPNHFHLLIEIADISLSKIIQVMLTAYTMYFNKKYDHVGHVFQGRFKSIVVDKDEYLLQACRYIHLNPVKANLVSNPKDYPWSSYQDIMNNNPILVETDHLLSLFTSDTTRQIELFEQFTLSVESTPTPGSDLDPDSKV